MNNNGLEPLRSQDRTAAVSGEVIIVVGEHGGAIHVFPGGADAQNFCVSVFHGLAQTIFRRACAKTPEIRGVMQLSPAFVDVKIDGLWRRTGNYNTVIPCRLEISCPVSA